MCAVLIPQWICGLLTAVISLTQGEPEMLKCRWRMMTIPIHLKGIMKNMTLSWPPVAQWWWLTAPLHLPLDLRASPPRRRTYLTSLRVRISHAETFLLRSHFERSFHGLVDWWRILRFVLHQKTNILGLGLLLAIKYGHNVLLYFFFLPPHYILIKAGSAALLGRRISNVYKYLIFFSFPVCAQIWGPNLHRSSQAASS